MKLTQKKYFPMEVLCLFDLIFHLIELIAPCPGLLSRCPNFSFGLSSLADTLSSITLFQCSV